MFECNLNLKNKFIMKRSLLFLSLILCFAVVNAQNINVKQFKNVRVKSAGQKTIVNPNHIPTTFKVVNNTKDPIPAGYARVTLTAGDVWGDGSGYQMLLDADATAYGVEIPTTGNLSDTSAASIAALPAIYSAFEYKIPTNADGSLTTTNIVMNNSVTIDIPAGTYDYVITNPTPGALMYIASNGRVNDYVFNDGQTYVFSVSLNPSTGNDIVKLLSNYDVALSDLVVPASGLLTNAETITVTVTNTGVNEATNVPLVCMVNQTPLTANIASIASGATANATFTADLSTMGEYEIYVYSSWSEDLDRTNDTVATTTSCVPATSITWNFNDGVLPYDWRLYNVDGLTPNEEIASIFTTTNGWEILQYNEEGTDFIAAAASYFETPGTADRWIVTNQVNLQGGNYLQFDAMSYSSSYPESLEVKLATSGDQTSNFTTMLKSIESLPGGAFTTYTVDLSAYTGQVRFAFRLTSHDAYICLLDNIKVLGNASGLNDVTTSTFGVYPNPANDFVTISDANGADVKVIDMLGRTLIAKTIKSSNETISISDLQTGMYMIQMNRDGKVSSQKLIKK